MNKRFHVLLFTFLVAVVGVALSLVLRPPEPTYKGKPVTVWLRSLTNGSAGEDSKKALVETGLLAVPYLVTAFEKKDRLPVKAYSKIWHSLPGVIQKFLPEPFPWGLVRAPIAEILGRIGNVIASVTVLEML